MDDPASSDAPAASVAAVGATPLGVLPAGRQVFNSFRPSVASPAIARTPDLKESEDIIAVLPLSERLSLMMPSRGKRMQLRVAPFFDRKMKRTACYVAG